MFSKSSQPFLPCSYPDDFLNRINNDFSVSDLTGFGGFPNDFNNFFPLFVIRNDFEFYFRQKIHLIFTGSPFQGDPFLAAPSLDIGHSHTDKTFLLERSSNGPQSFWPYESFNLFHHASLYISFSEF